jgi:predicted LPLAT superfamily acyltransferase
VIKQDISHVYKISEALQKNELVCIHADRFMDGNKTVLKTFLRGQAKFPEGPFALAAAFQVPVSFVFAFKERITHYHFYGSSLKQRADHESKRDFTSRLLSSFVEELEEKIKMYPDQWFNYYNFWE